jgi:hypothetical protein
MLRPPAYSFANDSDTGIYTGSERSYVHILVVVIMPLSEAQQPNFYTTEALNPFDLALEVEPYEVRCHCIYYNESDGSFGNPNAHCSRCMGTGTHPSTFNDMGQWDHWVFGGRWAGWMTGVPHERNTDPYPNVYLNMARGHLVPQGRRDRVSAVVDPKKEWHALHPNDPNNCLCTFDDFVKDYPDHLFIACDLHR